MGGGETRTFPCQTPVCGQFVQIYMETLDRRNMNICEVTVQGYLATCTDESAISTATTTQTTSTALLSTTTPTSTSNVLSTTLTTPTTSASSTKPTTNSKTTTRVIIVETISPLLAPTTSKTAAITTASSTETSKALLLPGNNTTTATSACPCACGVSSNTANLTKETLVQLAKEFRKELTVNKKETSISKRKLISVGDERHSAETIGCIGVLALCIPVLLIVLFDLISLWSLAKQKQNRVMPK